MARRFDLATVLRRRPPTPIGSGKVGVDVIKSRFESGHARANRFRVFLPLVSNEVPSSERQGVEILCDSVTLPGRQLTTDEYYTSMRATQIAYAFGVAPITMTFYLTNNWEAWNYINDWHKQIITELDGNKGYRLNFKKDYEKDFFIEHLNTEDETTKLIKVTNAFPSTLNEISLGNEIEGLVRASVTFVYDNWNEVS